MRKFYTIAISFLLLFSAGASGKPANKAKLNTANKKEIHSILTRNPDWLEAARKTEAKWGVPVNVQLAIMHTESNFRATAKNPKSTAFGYAQAINGTWSAYQRQTGRSGSRSNFEAASDFIGWYAHNASRKLGISKENAYGMYIAYHDGIGRYKRSVQSPNSRVSRLARTVQKKAVEYDQVLNSLV